MMRLTGYGKREIALGTLVFLLVSAGCVWAGLALHPALYGVLVAPVLVYGWLLSFFRNPTRTIPTGETLVLSAADGTITHIEEVDEPTFIGGRALRISTFLSIFNVHLNRAPYPGTVAHIAYKPGEFLDARDVDSGHRNERNDLGLTTDHPKANKIMVRQISGLIARRIVCDVKEGQALGRGEIFGMIKFGSRTDIFLPAEANLQVRVKVGDTVKAGETIMGELPA